MIVEAPAEFWAWLVGLDAAARRGDRRARERHDVALALLMDLYDVRFPPQRERETSVMAWVRHARRHPVWRLVGHGPSGAEVRFHCAFPVGTGVALITSTHGDQAKIGDLFPRHVIARAEAMVDHWLTDRARGERSVRPGFSRGFESGDEHVALGLVQVGAPYRVSAIRETLHRGVPLRRPRGVRPVPRPAA